MAKKQRYFEVVSKYKDKNINLPQRQTKNAVGYDFEAAEDIIIPSLWDADESPEPTLVPTGIKAYFPEDEGLFLCNRSSNPIKNGLLLANGIGCIESDYVDNPSNEGQILFAFWNLFPWSIHISKGQRIGQGLFQKILLVDNDDADRKRTGGWGSSGD